MYMWVSSFVEFFTLIPNFRALIPEKQIALSRIVGFLQSVNGRKDEHPRISKNRLNTNLHLVLKVSSKNRKSIALNVTNSVTVHNLNLTY